MLWIYIFTYWQILWEMLMEKLKKRQTYDMSLWKLKYL